MTYFAVSHLNGFLPLARRLRAVLTVACAVIACAAWPGSAAWAQAVTENFDQVQGCTITPVPPTGNLVWINLYCMDPRTVTQTPNGFVLGMVSEPHIGFMGFEEPVRLVSAGAPFTLQSAQITSVWRDGVTLTVEAFRGSDSIGVVTLSPSATAPTLVTFPGFINIDSAVFTATGGTHHPGHHVEGDGPHFALDDVGLILGPAHAITVTPPTHGTVTCTPDLVPEGESAVCTAQADAGYQVASFTGCTSDGTTNTCTLTNVTAPATVSATFAAAPVSVPTLNEWALMLLGLGAAGLGALVMRQRG